MNRFYIFTAATVLLQISIMAEKNHADMDPFERIEYTESIQATIDLLLNNGATIEEIFRESQKNQWPPQISIKAMFKFVKKLSEAELVVFSQKIPENLQEEFVRSLAQGQISLALARNLANPIAISLYIDRIKDNPKFDESIALKNKFTSIISGTLDNDRIPSQKIADLLIALQTIGTQESQSVLRNFLETQLHQQTPDLPQFINVGLFALSEMNLGPKEKSLFEKVIEDSRSSTLVKNTLARSYIDNFPASDQIRDYLIDPQFQSAFMPAVFRSEQAVQLLSAASTEADEEYKHHAFNQSLFQIYIDDTSKSHESPHSELSQFVNQRALDHLENHGVQSHDSHLRAILAAHQSSVDLQKRAQLKDTLFSKILNRQGLVYQVLSNEYSQPIEYLSQKIAGLNISVTVDDNIVYLPEETLKILDSLDFSDSSFTQQELSRAMLLLSMRNSFPTNLLASYLMARLGHISRDGYYFFSHRLFAPLGPTLTEEEKNQERMLRNILLLTHISLSNDPRTAHRSAEPRFVSEDLDIDSTVLAHLPEKMPEHLNPIIQFLINDRHLRELEVLYHQDSDNNEIAAKFLRLVKGADIIIANDLDRKENWMTDQNFFNALERDISDPQYQSKVLSDKFIEAAHHNIDLLNDKETNKTDLEDTVERVDTLLVLIRKLRPLDLPLSQSEKSLIKKYLSLLNKHQLFYSDKLLITLTHLGQLDPSVLAQALEVESIYYLTSTSLRGRHIFNKKENLIVELLRSQKNNQSFVNTLVNRLVALPKKTSHETVFIREITKLFYSGELANDQAAQELINYFSQSIHSYAELSSLLRVALSLDQEDFDSQAPKILKSIAKFSEWRWGVISFADLWHEFITRLPKKLKPESAKHLYAKVPRNDHEFQKLNQNLFSEVDSPTYHRANSQKMDGFIPHLIANENFKIQLYRQYFSDHSPFQYTPFLSMTPSSKKTDREEDRSKLTLLNDHTYMLKALTIDKYSIGSQLLLIEIEPYLNPRNSVLKKHFASLDQEYFLKRLHQTANRQEQIWLLKILERLRPKDQQFWRNAVASESSTIGHFATTVLAKHDPGAESFFLEALKSDSTKVKKRAVSRLYYMKDKLEGTHWKKIIREAISDSNEMLSRYAIMIFLEKGIYDSETLVAVKARLASLEGGFSGYFKNVALKGVISDYLKSYRNPEIDLAEKKKMEELLQANIHQQVEVITNLRTQILNIKKRLAKLIPIEDFEEIRALEKQLEVIENERNKVIKAVLADSMRNLEGQDRFENSFTVLNKVFHAIDTSNPTDATLSLIRKNLNALSEFNPGKFQTVSFDYLRSHYRKKGITNSKDIEQLIRSPKVDPADSFTFAAAIKRVLERLHQKGQLTSEPVTMAN